MKNTTIITSGKYRGEVIATPGGNTHPMGSREKIALFNMIQEFLPGAFVLDVYAGSGALGLEALSRGATSVLFIDNSSKACKIIQQNLKKLGMDETRGRVICKDVIKATTAIRERFPLVIVDPPYDNYRPEMITRLGELVAEDGLLVVSTPVEPPEIDDFELIKTRKYAKAYISIYSKIMS